MNKGIVDYIKEKRPNISNSSIKTYESILRNLYNNIGFKVNDDKYDLELFDKNDNKVINYLKDISFNKRKTILSALVVISNNNKFRELMMDDIKEYNKEEAKQVKNKKQEDNWVEKDEVMNIYNTLKKNATIIYKKDNITNTDLQEIQLYIIICLLGGIFIPPRRSKDYINFKIKNIDTDVDNYMDKNEFIFNSYKTAKTYGKQKITIPKELKTIINKWIKINPTDYLLFDSSKNQLSNVKLNQRLNKLFGKKAGVNQLRHTFLSDKYGDLIDKKNELENDFKRMGSSTLQENIYIKKK